MRVWYGAAPSRSEIPFREKFAYCTRPGSLIDPTARPATARFPETDMPQSTPTIFIFLVAATTLEACGDAVVRMALRNQGFPLRVVLFLAGAKLLFGYGVFVNLPVGSLHYFRNQTQKPVRLLIMVAPAGLEKLFFEIAQPVAPGATSVPPPTPEILVRIMTLAPNYGIEVKPPAH